MIYAHTGRPGAGKTLMAVKRGLEWRSEGRRVYELGINGLDHAATGIEVLPGARPFENSKEWLSEATAALERWAEVLQPGDVLIVDEIQRFIRRGSTRTSIPDWIEELTRNRHAGVDMLWTTQDPKNLEAFARRLVNEHRHFVNAHGKEKAKVYIWPDGVEEVDSPRERERADVQPLDYPKEIYSLYKSAELHTRKASTPRKVKLFRLLIALFVVLVVVAVLLGRHLMQKREPARSAGPASGQVGAHSLMGQLLPSQQSKQKAPPLTREEWLAQFKPRVDGLLWSAPIFDDRKAVSEPQTFCMSMENGPCKCITEQGTRFAVADKMCRVLARDGVYNPFRHELSERADAARSEPREREKDAPGRAEDFAEVYGEAGVPGGVPAGSGSFRDRAARNAAGDAPAGGVVPLGGIPARP